jgi:hypothetical protein
VADDITLVQVLAESPRLLANGDRGITSPHLHEAGAEVRVRPGQLLAGRQGLEDLDGLLGSPVRLLSAAQSPERGGKQAEVLPDAQMIAQLAPDPEGAAQCPLRLFPPIKQRILARGALVQRRQTWPVAFPGVPQGALELRRGLAVCAQRGGAPGRLRRVPQHGLPVPGALGMVREQGGIAIAALLQLRQQARVQLQLSVRRDRCLHRHPDQLVPEPQAGPIGHEDPGLQALIDP